MIDDYDDGFPIWAIIAIGIIVLLYVVSMGHLIYQELTANKICQDNGWDDAKMVTPVFFIGNYNYMCQTIVEDKWSNINRINSTDTFEVDKYKANPGVIK